MEDLKLHGTWISPFSHRVVWALKIKGIPYQHIEENLSNKSSLLLHYNPVHKKIPVLVHGGKPICESIIILEYIEKTWPEHPLLPTHPFERAAARFWIKYAEDKGSSVWMIYQSKGYEQEKAKKEILEMLTTIENDGLGDKKFFGGDKINMVDIAFGGIALWLEVIEDSVGFKLLESHEFPRLTAWVKNFKQVPVIKENLPNHDEMLEYFKCRLEMFLASA